MTAVEQFADMVQHSDNIVFFGGAGVSTESGIPDFRSVDGLYNQTYKYPPEHILSHTFYRENPEECSVWTPNPIWLISNWLNSKKQEN